MASKMLFCMTSKYTAFQRILVPSSLSGGPLDYYTFQDSHSRLAQVIDSDILLACMYDARSKVLSDFAEE